MGDLSGSAVESRTSHSSEPFPGSMVYPCVDRAAPEYFATMKFSTPAAVVRILLGLCAVGAFLSSLLWLGDPGPVSQFTQLPGSQAKERLVERWPAAVAADSVSSVDFEWRAEIDNHATWYRVTLSQEAAVAWIEHVHAEQVQTTKDLRERRTRIGVIEGIHRTVTQPPQSHAQSESVPAWWRPPLVDFRATEVMDWDGAYGRGT